MGGRKDPAERRAYERRYYNSEKGRALISKRNQRFEATTLGKSLRRSAMLTYRYGISPAQYQTLWEAQGGVCGICGERGSRPRLDVDHDHVSGKVRGLLCRRCNIALGVLGDSLDGLMRAFEYLLGQ